MVLSPRTQLILDQEVTAPYPGLTAETYRQLFIYKHVIIMPHICLFRCPQGTILVKL